MNQEQDLMTKMKRLKRIDQEGKSMTSEERSFFEDTKKKSERFVAQAETSIWGVKLNS